jgi:hypothetical protein
MRKFARECPPAPERFFVHFHGFRKQTTTGNEDALADYLAHNTIKLTDLLQWR